MLLALRMSCTWLEMLVVVSGRSRGAPEEGQGGRTPCELGAGERDRLRGPCSLTGVRIAGRSDMENLEGIAPRGGL